jgi:hypothetical protein
MSIKANLILALLALAFSALTAQTETWQWVQSAGGNSDDASSCVAADEWGNSFTAGTFQDTLNIGTFSLISEGDTDLYIAKADPDGSWLWAIRAGGAASEMVNGIALDPDGNICVTGIFYDSITFGDTTLECAVESDTLIWHDIFIAKMDAGGNWLWAKRAGGIYSDDVGGIAIDGMGNIFLAGTFMDTVAFGDSVLTSYGGCDIFAAKMDPDGNWLWANQAGSIEENTEYPFVPMGDFCLDLALDAGGNTYVSGAFVGTANFGDTSVSSAGEHDIFVGKLDPEGNWLWVSQAGGEHNNWGHKIIVDPADNIYIAGTYIENATFGDHILNAVITAYPQLFVAGLNSNGIWQWANQATAYDLISVGGLALDDTNNLLLAGYFDGEASFGATIMISLGGSDVYLAKMDPDGNWLYTMQAGGLEDDQGTDVCVNGNEIFLTGSFSDSAMFGDYSLTSSGMADAFVARIVQYTPVLDETEAVPAAFTLNQNSPNPFKTGTTIPVRIGSGEGHYKLCVYDIRGRRVATLVDGPLARGEHQISWEGRDSQNRPLPSGVYFYRLQSDSGSSVKKMILHK